MTTYYAVVKYALDDSDEEKVDALRRGLSEIAMSLVAEFGFDLEKIEDAMADAQSDAEMELDAKRFREEDEKDDG